MEDLKGTVLEVDRFKRDGGGAGSSSGFLSLKCGSVVVGSSGTSSLPPTKSGERDECKHDGVSEA